MTTNTTLDRQADMPPVVDGRLVYPASPPPLGADLPRTPTHRYEHGVDGRTPDGRLWCLCGRELVGGSMVCAEVRRARAEAEPEAQEADHGPHPDDRVGCQLRCKCGAKIDWPRGRAGGFDRCPDSGFGWKRRSA